MFSIKKTIVISIGEMIDFTS